MITIQVGRDDGAYDVLVGDLSAALDKMVALADGQPLPLVTDPRVLALHGHRLAAVTLQPPILVPEGEAAKSWDTLAAIISSLADRSVRRGTPILAFGGGSIGDVTGLAASLYQRALEARPDSPSLQEALYRAKAGRKPPAAPTIR